MPVAAGLAFPRNRAETPYPLAGARIVGADIALRTIAPATRHARQNLAVDHDHAAGRAANAGLVVDDIVLPDFFAGARVQAIDHAVRRVDEEIVAPETEAAGFFGRRAGAGRAWRRTDAVFPDQVAGLGVQRLDGVVGIAQEHDPVMDQGRRFVGAALVHRPHPLQLQVANIAVVDLLERFRVIRDESAFAFLVRRHGPVVFGVCRRLLGDSHEAEDAFQATFLILVRRIGAIRWRKSIS